MRSVLASAVVSLRPCGTKPSLQRVEREFGHRMADMEKFIERRLKLGKKIFSPLTQLAVTACLEHFTAGLASILLETKAGHGALRRMGEPYRSLWIWHALEELEHKSVVRLLFSSLSLCILYNSLDSRDLRLTWISTKLQREGLRRLLVVYGYYGFSSLSPSLPHTSPLLSSPLLSSLLLADSVPHACFLRRSKNGRRLRQKGAHDVVCSACISDPHYATVAATYQCTKVSPVHPYYLYVSRFMYR